MKWEWTQSVVAERDASGKRRRLEEHETAVEVQDGGQAQLVEFANTSETGLFVRLQSWDDQRQHAEISHLLNRRVRVTVEVLDDD
jgi:hypothetical protein